jgi:hypothetical protein
MMPQENFMKFGNRKNATDRQATVMQAQAAPEPAANTESEAPAAKAKVDPSEAVTEQVEAPPHVATQDATSAS